ncbi:hypothetical protein LAZ67_3000717 [Cordylochernes scorpioides]|uniref:C2H2-type domain-containing protein n=1 Tax=Cordylochernes scorpioides TaxID=51811 RepID=A0ABY6K6F3_9ARAC|nr:hypothetical protein LAZ67_3000717 [Cordylochernes scorpioides]
MDMKAKEKINIPGISVAKDVFENGQMFKECQYCKNLLESKKELWEHYRTNHSDVRKFSCETCLYTTTIKFHLKVHIDIHAMDRTHKCDICKASFKMKLSLARHKRDNHIKVISHKCKHCDFKTKWLKSLKSHEEIHAKWKNFKCSRCDFVTTGKSNLKLHEYDHDNKKYLTCMFCDYTTLKSSHLETHTRTHTGERPFECEFCFFRTTTKQRLETHVRIHLGEKPFKCSQCTERFCRNGISHNSQRIWVVHVTPILGNIEEYQLKPVLYFYNGFIFTKKINIPGISVAKDVFENGQMFKECQYCKNLLESKKELWEHYRTNHSDVRKFSCETCLYTTTIKFHLKVHIDIHAMDRTHKCDICKASFKMKLSLARHKRDNHIKVISHKCKHCNFKTKWLKSLKSHEEIYAKWKNFKCSRCDFVTTGKSNLKLHEYDHDNKKYLTCMFCDYTTLKSSHLETHTRTHTGERPFECEFCFFRTTTKQRLETHVRIHLGEKPFKCSQCTERFCRKDYLQRHAKKH